MGNDSDLGSGKVREWSRVKHSNEFNAFDALVGKVLSVPHEEIQRREREYQKQATKNPRRRGPKRKVKPSA
jgi:hypothetical protein